MPKDLNSSSMTVRETLAIGKAALAGHETDTPDLDAALLLADAMDLTRARLYMELGEEVPGAAAAVFSESLDRRVAGEPVAWIVGMKEFWGREYRVGPGVLCPRPDSEVLIEEALAMMDQLTPEGRLHDCCTGPGTLALALKADRPGWEVSASDISDKAARYFTENNERLCAGGVTYHRADLMDGIDGPFEIIVSNPPYLTPGETTERTALGWKEPVLALDGGGDDGLDLIRRLIPRAADRLVEGGGFLMEADPLQMPLIREILVDTGFRDIGIRRDYGDRDRVITAWKG